MLNGEIIAVCPQILIKPTNDFIWQNVELLNANCDGTKSSHRVVDI